MHDAIFRSRDCELGIFFATYNEGGMSDARREERMIHGSDGRFELCMNRLFCAATFLSVANNASL